jgi:hypothetical protein
MLDDRRLNGSTTRSRYRHVHGRRQKLTPQDMLPDIGYVKAGLGQIIKHQKEGWSYISG